jgi:hypothetical protein
MKKTTTSKSARTTLGVILFILAIALLCSVPLIQPGAQLPTGDAGSGHVGPAPGGPNATWSQVIATNPGGVNNLAVDDSSCVEGVNCEHFKLTVNGTPADWAGQKVRVTISWQDSADEYDIYIHRAADCSDKFFVMAANGPGVTNQVADIDVASKGTGDYCVRVALNTTPDATDKYSGAAAAVPLVPPPPPAAPQDTGAKIGYENFEAPGQLVPASQLSSGAVTVEYMGRGAGEPSVGANWASGLINFQSDLQTLFVKFNDDPTQARALWDNRRAPTSQFIDSDPIGFTDHYSPTANRVFASELTLLSPDTVKISHSDDDGVTWVPDQTGGVASAVDHQTIGGGPYNPNSLPPANPAYPHAIYYCSQDIATALCSRSDDGGIHYGPSVPIYTLTQCGGLHGHVKVAPDGTVYVPNRGCGPDAAVALSTDNGNTWAVRPINSSSISGTAASDDPAVSIDTKNKVYALMAQNGTAAVVATSIDQGKSWQNIYNVGAGLGLTNIAFPAATAGDDGRAAVAFYASKGGSGDSSADPYSGTWHLYIAHTFDGGAHWTTTDATPSLPMQRMGLLRGGGGPVDRNLLDFFDLTTDRDGRVVVGYVNGCSGGDCSQAPVNADGSTSVAGNTYSATASIMRQSSGRRMFAAKDPAAASVPGMPFVTIRRVGGVVHLAWNEADPGNNGGTPADQSITNFQVFRSTADGALSSTPIATLPGTASRYDDATATDAKATYYYRVVASNSIGSSAPSIQVAAPYVGDSCAGLVIHQNLPTNPEATGSQPTGVPVGPSSSPSPTPVTNPPVPQYLIDYIAVGEPPDKAGKLMFKMKVRDLSTLPPNSRWRLVWDWTGINGRKETINPDEQYYVGMTADATGTPTFEYGTVQTASLVVIGIPEENMQGAADAASNFTPDGTITIYIDKSKVGNPQPGDFLSAINGRTFSTGDSQAGEPTLQRSTLLVDHTFIKGNTDTSYPPATYTVTGGVSCSALEGAPNAPAAPAQLLNISTRVAVQGGDNVGIAGFIVVGSGSDNVLLRGLGPSLSVNGTPVNGRLSDPTLELHDKTGNLIAFNDNWQDSQASEVQSTGLPPSDQREAAMVKTLNTGAYTAVLRGKNDSSGIGLVEAYDLIKSPIVQLANISTRGFVQTGDNVMIGGFIAGPTERASTAIVIRAIGPTLSSANVPSPLQDPMLELHDQNGNTIASNDDWATDLNAAQVAAAGLAPNDARESALYRFISPTQLTAVVRGKDDSVGNALVEIYNLQ